ncbi:MAG: glutaminase A [Synechococcales bacterium]|nr:glutaminase A [Synechococcales bacterium]
MGRLEQLDQAQLNAIVERAKPKAQLGRLPDYIPLLAQVKTERIAVQVASMDGSVLTVDEIGLRFVLMSVIKPFLLLFALHHFGTEIVFQQVGQDPSDQPFHSVAQLANDRGHPRNPMINSGAIALTEFLPGVTSSERCEHLRQWLNQQAGCELTLDLAMLASVRSLGNESNRAIANLLKQAGHLGETEVALDTYNQICCLSGTITDLAKLGLLLVCPHSALLTLHQQSVMALMLTCGLYEVSGEYAVRIGLPIKSGVSGVILAVIPKQGAIAIYSPEIDVTGNSIAGLCILEQLVQQLDISLFAST